MLAINCEDFVSLTSVSCHLEEHSAATAKCGANYGLTSGVNLLP